MELLASWPTILQQRRYLFVCSVVLIVVILMWATCWNANPETIVDLDKMKTIVCKGRKVVKLVNACPANVTGFVTVIESGRLGNVMFNYAGVLLAARFFGLRPFIPPCMLVELERYFVNLSVPLMSECGKSIQKQFVSWSAWHKTPEVRSTHGLVLGPWFQDPPFFSKFVNETREIFQFNDDLLTYAHKQLVKAARSFFDSVDPDLIFVGVHVRRTDYNAFLQRKHNESLAQASYFFHAMKYFHDKFNNNTIFVVMSDDLRWCRDQLKSDQYRIYINDNGKSNPGQDLAVLSKCNHSIIDYGTFGLWGALLTHGEGIVYNVKKEHSTEIASLLNWKVLRA